MWYNVNITVNGDFEIEADNIEEAMEEVLSMLEEVIDIEITEI